jgi:hypothetical protein
MLAAAVMTKMLIKVRRATPVAVTTTMVLQ